MQIQILYIVHNLKVVRMPSIFTTKSGAVTLFGVALQYKVPTDCVFTEMKPALECLQRELEGRLMIVRSILARANNDVIDVEYRPVDILQEFDELSRV